MYLRFFAIADKGLSCLVSVFSGKDVIGNQSAHTTNQPLKGIKTQKDFLKSEGEKLVFNSILLYFYGFSNL